MDFCSNPKGCSYVNLPPGTTCDDGNPCNLNDKCTIAGKCFGIGLVTCDDGSACTLDSCDIEVGCVFLAQAVTCSDGNPCTVGDNCAEGKCAAGKNALACDDNKFCTTDSCDSVAGCLHTPNAIACDDNNACTKGDACAAGSCVAGKYACACTLDADCNDKNVCTADTCFTDPGTQIKSCKNTAIAGVCDDANACTVGDACSAGACLPGAVTTCDDLSICTDDSCNPNAGSLALACVHKTAAATVAACDGKVVNGKCLKVFQKSLTWLAAETACTQWSPDAHLASASTAGYNTDINTIAKSNCPKDNTNNTVSAWIGLKDTTKAYGWSWSDGSKFSYTNWNSNEPNNQGLEIYVEIRGDGKWNNSDGNATQSCYVCSRPAPLACDDGNACTTGDYCAAGSCLNTGATSCDDGSACTADSCDSKKGCVNTVLPDNTQCAAQSCGIDGLTLTPKSVCAGGACIAAVGTSCKDANGCTDDTCDATAGCAHPNNTAACNDGDGCTANDKCAGGVCKGGGATDCNDKNDCTVDSCAANNCVHVNVSVSPVACKGTLWKNHCYEAFKVGTKVNYAAAVTNCDTNNKSLLASISSADENEIIRGQLAAVCAGLNPSGGWVGGVQPVNADWKASALTWADGSPATFRNWSSTEPNSASENNLEFTQNGVWNDLAANDTRYCYVCERLMAPACNDSNSCTSGDYCTGNVCSGLPVECSDKCKVTAACVGATGCPSLSAATNSKADPEFCGPEDDLVCSNGSCNAKSTFCTNKSCGFDTETGLTECGRCNNGYVCVSNACVSNTAPKLYTKAGKTLLPGGAFAMGCVPGDTGCDTDEAKHMAFVEPFYIDNNEAAVASYKLCTTAQPTKCTAISSPYGVDYPINGIGWSQARAYCQFLGGDLPTEAQWEFAARYNGLTNLVATTIYPWGNQWPTPDGKAPANLGIDTLVDGVVLLTAANVTTGVDTVPGTSIINMMGNLREWCMDTDICKVGDPQVYNPLCFESAYPGRMVRGGSYQTTTAKPFQARISNRNYQLDGSYFGSEMGVRCVYPFVP